MTDVINGTDKIKDSYGAINTKFAEFDAHLADYTTNAIKRDGSVAMIADLTFNMTDPTIQTATSSRRLRLAGGTDAQPTFGGYINIEGVDFGGTGAGGNIYLVPMSGKKAYVFAGGNNNEVWHEGNLDYEEGSWTPVMAGSTTAGTHTYSTQTGSYVKTGKLVHIQFRLIMTAKDVAMAGAARITGLPFAIGKTGSAVLAFGGITLGTDYTGVGASLDVSSVLSLIEMGSGKTLTGLPVAAITDTSRVEGSLCYEIA